MAPPREYYTEGDPLMGASSSRRIERKSFFGSTSDFWFWYTNMWREESVLLFRLAVPTVIINVTVFVPMAILSSFAGRVFGDVALSGLMIGNSFVNVVYLSIIQGLLSACDTLCPQAVGLKNYSDVGIVALRGFIVAMVYCVVPICLDFIVGLRFLLNKVIEEEEVVDFAVSFIQIWSISLPFYIWYNLTWKFLSAQEVVYPLVFSGLLSALIILPSCLLVIAPVLNFDAIPVSYLVFQIAEIFILMLFLKSEPYIPETWPQEISFAEKLKSALHVQPLLDFFHLALGGILATTEWWFWEVLSVIVAQFGVKAIAAHAVPYQFLSIAYMFVMGVGIAFNIRIGSSLSSEPERSKHLCLGGLMCGATICTFFSSILYFHRDSIIRIFTMDNEVIDLCNEIWPFVAIYTFFVCFFGFMSGIVNAIGYQWTLGGGVLIVLWLITVPSIWYACVTESGGFVVLWKILYIPYALVDLYILFVLFRVDWNELYLSVQSRNSSHKKLPFLTEGKKESY